MVGFCLSDLPLKLNTELSKEYTIFLFNATNGITSIINYLCSVDYIAETIQHCSMTMIIGENTSNDADYKTKVKELCQTILDDPALKEVFDGIDKFMEDDEAKELFTKMQSTAESLQMKQQSGLELTAGELEEYNKARDKMMENQVAIAFVAAQSSIQKVHETIGKAVSMVFENGRVPTDEEFESHCCGSGGCGSC